MPVKTKRYIITTCLLYASPIYKVIILINLQSIITESFLSQWNAEVVESRRSVILCVSYGSLSKYLGGIHN